MKHGGDDALSDALIVCPACSTESEHEVIRRTSKGNGEDILARCMDCSHVHTIHLRPPRMVRVRATLSDGNASSSADIEVDDDEVISVGDIFEHDGITWRVTRIDNSESRLVNSLVATRIHSIWANRCDKAVVGITMNYGDVSESTKIECDPDRVFSCGSILVIDGKKWRVRGIHTGKGRTLTGKRSASEVRRIYLQDP